MSATANSHRPDAATITGWVEAAIGVATAAADDTSLPFERENLELLCAIKANDPAAYQRIRAILKNSKVQVGELDRLINKALGEGLGEDDDRAADPAHWTVEPWADPVDGAMLADELVDVFTCHIVLPPSGAEAIALWVLHCWCIDAAEHSPLLAFVSPERRCGKSSALTLLLWLCPRSEQASSITASVIYRFVEQSQPTLLIDELDNAIEDNRDLLAILNGGHNRAMARVLRSVGDGMDFKPQRFSAWSPKALGTIKILPGTLADRSIIIPMSRKRRGDVVMRVLSTDNAQFARLRSQCLRWSEDHAAELKGADPSLPKALDDRASDNWRPLKAICRCAGRSLVEALRERGRGAVARARRGRDDRSGAAPGVEGDLR
jgi:putative DNA primase/helicase